MLALEKDIKTTKELTFFAEKLQSKNFVCIEQAFLL